MRFLIPAFLCLTASTFAQGGAAILPLGMPPPGGEGYSALQSGGAFPTGATSLYYNPALLAELERSTGSQLHAAFSRQTWPEGLGGISSQNFSGVSGSIPGSDGLDMGIGFFRNQIDFGTVLTSSGQSSSYHAVENVYGLGAAVRLGFPVSVGGAVKYYDAQYSQSRVSGWAFDLGASANPHFHPAASVGVLSLETRPAAGVALQNMGPDVRYSNPEVRDPLPRVLRAALGLEAEFADLVEASVAHEWEREWLQGRSWSSSSATRTYGVSLAVAGFRYGWAWLEDPAGGRSESYEAYQYEFEALQAYRLWRRILRWDFVSAPEAFETGYPLKAFRVLGVSFRPNPRFVIGKRAFEEDSEEFRSAQKAWFAALSI
jgi:hypothetical protein